MTVKFQTESLTKELLWKQSHFNLLNSTTDSEKHMKFNREKKKSVSYDFFPYFVIIAIKRST